MGQHGKVQHSHYNHQKNGDFPSQAHLILIALHNSQRTFFVLNMGTITTQNTQERSSSCPHWKNSEYHRSFHLPCYLAISLCSLLPPSLAPRLSVCLSLVRTCLCTHLCSRAFQLSDESVPGRSGSVSLALLLTCLAPRAPLGLTHSQIDRNIACLGWITL